MDEAAEKLVGILGEELFRNVTSTEAELTNLNDIHCQCDTLILRPNNAKLTLANESMLTIEKELKFTQAGDGLFKSIIRGCYWLVDDMYKFEHMGYTRELNASNLPQQAASETLKGLRYLACAECNLCPLGWFDPQTKESYLHIWVNKKETTT